MQSAQTTAILLNFLREEIKKTGLTRAVIGLSGGIDSAVVCALCAGALGPEKVYTICLPYRASNPESEAHARLCAETFGVHYQVIDITPQIDAYFDSVDKDAPALRRGNKMARERMTILYDHSAKLGGLVIGTSNKTELLLGYGTQHGDMASALNPIGDIYKTQIFELAGYLKVPEPIIKKAPSADLWQGQSDEAELGYTYAQIDELLAELIDQRVSERALKEKFAPVFVDRIIKLVKKSQFKRRLPLIAKLSARTIDREFRYPRDWGV
ncbi:MAG: NAD+ synthase [Candidatus Margulisbacteria bacterium]|jgi:NAD+ synthase|nr:NAD+ synthase [Candidatus Margulisiibacteriota bacterium]